MMGCSGSAPLAAKAIELNDQATEALARGDLETADARLQVALEYHPRFVEALTNLGLVELERGNFARARTLLARAKRINPDVAQPHHGLGVLEERRGRLDRASRHYQEALAVDPGFAPARANLGRLYYNAGDFERARSQFLRLTEVAPEEPLGYTGLSDALVALGRSKEADSITERAFGLFGPTPELVLQEGRRRLRQEDHAGAAFLFAHLTDRGDDYAHAALSWLAVAELARDRPRYAVSAAERALDLNPDAPVAIYALALALHRLNDGAALEWLKRAQELEPGRPLIEQALAARRGEEANAR